MAISNKIHNVQLVTRIASSVQEQAKINAKNIQYIKILPIFYYIVIQISFYRLKVYANPRVLLNSIKTFKKILVQVVPRIV